MDDVSVRIPRSQGFLNDFIMSSSQLVERLSSSDPFRIADSICAILVIFYVSIAYCCFRISNFNDASINNAPIIAVSCFCIAVTLVFAVEYSYELGEKFWLIVDASWVLTSTASFVIGAMYISSEAEKTESIKWKLNVNHEQDFVRSEISSFRDIYCSTVHLSGSYSLIKACDSAISIQKSSSNILTLTSRRDYLPQLREVENLPLPDRSLKDSEYLQVVRIRNLIDRSNESIRNYNANRIRVNPGVDAQFIRNIWFWIFPFIAGIRVTRPWRKIIAKRLGPTHSSPISHPPS